MIGLAGVVTLAVPLTALADAQTTLLSVSTDGTQGDGPSFGPTISQDGAVVAFISRASNLVGADTNGVEDAFVRLRSTGSTVRVSVGSDGTKANDQTFEDVASGSGRYIAYSSN